MKINLHSPLEEVQIQIIPLIDVVFCILTFFLLAALQFTRQQAINVDLPKASTGTTTGVISSLEARDILPVTIDAIGQIYVEKQPVQRQELKAILEDYIKKSPNGTIVLNASRSATYNDVIELLDLLREVGGERVSLGILSAPSEQLTTPPLPTSPDFPNNPGIPGITPLPNSSPLTPLNPQLNPNLNLPSAPNQPLSPTNPSNSDVLPQAPATPRQKQP
jgi:biopolymer transport protein ExbD